MSYVKVFEELLDSTIWREPPETKVVWMTMLVMANQHGEVMASIPGLADRARVSMDDALAALECLKSPDKWSRTQENEGRRIVEIDGGWKLLNYLKYRSKMNAAERREYNRIKKREQRERDKEKAAEKSVNDSQSGQNSSLTLNDSQQCQHIAEAEAEAEVQKQPPGTGSDKSDPPPKPPVSGPSAKEVQEAWNELGGKFPSCRALSETRKRHIKARLGDEFWCEHWREALTILPSSPFHRGENKDGWKATFDWFIRPDSVAKLIEGKENFGKRPPQVNGQGRLFGVTDTSQYQNVGK